MFEFINFYTDTNCNIYKKSQDFWIEILMEILLKFVSYFCDFSTSFYGF
jgi:hypothetical protein